MGKIRKIGKKWQIDYRDKGRRIRKIVGTSKAVAETILKDIEVRQARDESGLFVKNILIDDFIEKCRHHTRLNHRERAALRYSQVLAHFKRFLDSHHHSIKYLNELSPDVFEEYKRCRAKKVSASTINTELKALHSFFTWAEAWGYSRENPLKKTPKFSLIEKSIPRFYSKEEIKKIFDSTPQPYLNIFKVLLYTGMRRNELRYLESEDIDLKRKRIYIRVKKGFIPKTSERTIPIHKAIMPILRDRISHSHSGLIFPNKKGNVYEAREWWKVIRRICKDLNIKDAKIHTFRHTFASWLVMSGVGIMTVKRLLGHSDIKTTMIYSHLAESHLDESIKKLSF